MDDKDLEIILALDEFKNITKAAERLFLTQPGLSSRIKRIEKELGTEILNRDKKGVSFTPSGEILIQYVKEISDTYRQMREQVLLSQETICGTLKLGCSLNYAHFVLPEHLQVYLKKYPLVNVSITADRASHIYRRLVQGAYNAAIIRGKFKWSEHRELISSEQYYLVSQHPINMDTLPESTYIHHKSDSVEQRIADEWVRRGLSGLPQSNLECNSLISCISMVENGLGWSVLPDICLKNFSGYREPVSMADGRPLLLDTYLYYKKSDLKLAQVQKFIEQINSIPAPSS